MQRQALCPRAFLISSSSGTGPAVDHLSPQPGGGHQQARRAKATLDRAVVDERLLQGVQLARLAPGGGQPFDRQDLLARRPAGRHRCRNVLPCRPPARCTSRTARRRSRSWCRSAPGRGAGRRPVSCRGRPSRHSSTPFTVSLTLFSSSATGHLREPSRYSSDFSRFRSRRRDRPASALPGGHQKRQRMRRPP